MNILPKYGPSDYALHGVTRVTHRPPDYALHGVTRVTHSGLDGCWRAESKVLENSVLFSAHSAEGEGDLRTAMSAVALAGTGEVQRGVVLGKVIPQT